MGLKIVCCAVAVLTAIVVLSFVAPTESEKPFWRWVQRVRDRIDSVSYWIFNAIAILMGLLVLYAIASAVLKG